MLYLPTVHSIIETMNLIEVAKTFYTDKGVWVMFILLSVLYIGGAWLGWRIGYPYVVGFVMGIVVKDIGQRVSDFVDSDIL